MQTPELTIVEKRATETASEKRTERQKSQTGLLERVRGNAKKKPRGNQSGPNKPKWKRNEDFVALFLILPVLAPLLLLIALWVKLTSKGPILFRQERVGMNGEKFTFFKFRSMRTNVDTMVHENHVQHLVETNGPMVKLDVLGDPRVIPGGGILRALGLDELPQILNVLKGEMSLVGPRPCTTQERKLYRDDQKRRFDVVPGLTGYWQVKGKNNTTFTQMIEMDEYYVDNQSLRLDLAILIRTPFVLCSQLFEMIGTRFRVFRRQSQSGDAAG